MPGIAACSYSTEWLGRRPVVAGGLLVAGLSCSIAALLDGWALTALALVGRFFVSGVFSVIYTYDAEIFPTPVRTGAVGLLSTCGRLGGMAAGPVAMAGHAPALLTFGAPMIAAGVACAAVLPETRGRALPHSVAEVAPSPLQCLRHSKFNPPGDGSSKAADCTDGGNDSDESCS